MRYKIFFVSIMAMLCLFFSTSTSSAANWYLINSNDESSIFIDSSNVCYQIDSNGNKNYDIIQYWEKMVYLDEETYSIKRCILSLSDRRVYWYEYTAYDYDGNVISNGNRNGYSIEILPESVGEEVMRVVSKLAH